MPVFARVSGEMIECIPFARYSAQLSDADDQLFARDAGTNKLIYPDATAAGDLLPVTGLAVTDGPDHFSVTIGWTNPAQPDITPTDIQVRVAELGAVWTEIPAAADEWSWTALEASSEYVAQVRYIQRVDGILVETSAVRSVSFTTTAAPLGPPAEDPGSPGGTDTVWPIGNPIGGGTPPSTPDGCWWEWALQIMELDTTVVSWLDTGITGTEDGDGTNISYDTTSLDNTRTYRMCKREACDTNGDGTADEFGEWECSPPFPGAFDWGVTCGAIPLSRSAALDVAADATWAFPRYCNIDDTGVEMVDAISNTQIGKGADFAALYADEAGEWGVVADADGGITMTAALAAIPTTIGQGLDFTVASQLRFSPGHTLSNGRTTTIASAGQGAVVWQIIETATGWYPRVSFRLTSSYISLEASELPLDDLVHTLTLYFDADSTKRLWVDGVEGDSDTSGDDLHASVIVQPMYWTAMTGFGTSFQQLGWDRLLTDNEIASLTDEWLVADEYLFNYTGAVQQVEVPSGMTRMRIEAYGSAGGAGSGGDPGYGGFVVADVDVTPTDVYDIYVGGNTGWPNGGAGTPNGSGHSGVPGGGASFITPEGDTIAEALVVAPGGGGGNVIHSGNVVSGGDGGYLAGEDGEDGNTLGGDGATQIAGGAGGSGGLDGSFGQGGDGGPIGGSSLSGGGPGGGGGWYGGGGGGSTGAVHGAGEGGGGGGSGKVNSPAVYVRSEDGTFGSTTLGQVRVKFLP